MKKRFLIPLIAGVLLPGVSHALGIGKLQLDSALNEPFEARIEILSATREEMDSLAVTLADSEAFARAGVERPFVLSQLRFEIVETEEGRDYIRVSSQESIREPFLNFLVEVNWSRGRLFREYTVLLDPPLYDPNVRSIAAAPEPAPAPSMPLESPSEPSDYEAPVSAPADTAAGTFTGSEYGPTVATDTLWSIASAARPDSSVSIQQMMLALLRANPEAFIDGNVNGLRRGMILRMPDREEITSLSAAEALDQIRSQYAAWQGVRESAAAAPTERPDTSYDTGASGDTTPAADTAPDSAELRLVAADTGGTGTADSAPGGGGGDLAGVQSDLALTREQLEASRQENTELKDRLAENEAIVEDLKRLISLKDEELNALEEQLKGRTTEGGAAEPVAAETPPAAETPAPEAEAPVTKAEAPAKPKPAKADKPKPAAEKPKPAPAPAPAPEPSLVEKVTGFVMGNLLLVGGGLLAVVLVAGGLAFAARRRSDGSDDIAAGAAFPDFSGSEVETEMPDVDSEDVTNVREDLQDGDAAPAQDATMVAPPPARAEPARQQAAAAPAASAPEEDPLAEVNVFLAYEHFDQAEEFVREAIGREPDNLDFHAKLLEVFYAAGDRKKYEDAARVLNDKVSGSGPYWESAVAMWQEMSPSRALFAEPMEGEDQAAGPRGGAGVLDLTAAAGRSGGDLGLDFDLGEATAESVAQAPAEEGVLDLTAGGDEAQSKTVSPAADEEDILDVTAAVGLDTAEEPPAPAAPSASDEDVLDITGGADRSDDVLDISQTGSDDLLDVTAHSNVGAQDLDEDPLDVTATSGPRSEAAPEEPAAPDSLEHTLDFNLDLPAPEAPADNVIEFEAAAPPAEEDGGLELDLSEGEDAAEPAGGGLELDMGDSDEGGLELSLEDESDAGAKEVAEGGIELDLSMDESQPEAGGLEIELDMPQEEKADDLDMEGTVEIPKLSLDMDDDDDDDDDDDARTVFVPRSADAQEQSAEDEIDTKLDLAKAYVELGEKDSARSILDEVMSGGNDKQRQKARELISQLS